MAIIQVIAGVGTAVLGVLCFLEKIDLIFPILGIFFCICLASINSILAMMEYKKDGAEKVYDEKIHEKIL